MGQETKEEIVSHQFRTPTTDKMSSGKRTSADALIDIPRPIPPVSCTIHFVFSLPKINNEREKKQPQMLDHWVKVSRRQSSR